MVYGASVLEAERACTTSSDIDAATKSSRTSANARRLRARERLDLLLKPALLFT